MLYGEHINGYFLLVTLFDLHLAGHIILIHAEKKLRLREVR